MIDRIQAFRKGISPVVMLSRMARPKRSSAAGSKVVGAAWRALMRSSAYRTRSRSSFRLQAGEAVSQDVVEVGDALLNNLQPEPAEWTDRAGETTQSDTKDHSG